MRYVCFSADYDGTLARHGEVASSTIEALKRVYRSGRKLVLVTGRQLGELLQVFPEAKLFDRVIAENGALLYRPADKTEKLLAEPPPESFVADLRQRGVTPLAVGKVIVATWRPNEKTVLEAIRDSGLALQVIFNKDAVMILPSSVNKATGLQAALSELGLSAHNVVGVGNAENDHVFLRMCEFAVAVANSIATLKERADYVTQGRQGEGVEELIQHLLADDLARLGANLHRHDLLLGRDAAGNPYNFNPYGTRVAIAGPSGGGKSTAVTAMVEQLMNSGYQVCLIDPEGDYEEFDSMITLGGADRVPAPGEVFEVLKRPEASVSVNLLGVSTADRPSHFLGLLPRIQELRAKTGRPHWLIIDEAHHLLPSELNTASLPIPGDLGSFALVTVHPDQISRTVLQLMNGLFIIGPDPAAVVRLFSRGAGKKLSVALPKGPELRSGEILAWMFARPDDPALIRLEPAKAELRRHRRKYASGELGEDKSFYFRGPEGKLNLRAQNLKIFTQLASGVDDATWLHHLRQGDYSRWLRNAVKDARIADEVAQVEQDRLPAAESRSRIIASLDKHYTAPA